MISSVLKRTVARPRRRSAKLPTRACGGCARTASASRTAASRTNAAAGGRPIDARAWRTIRSDANRPSVRASSVSRSSGIRGAGVDDGEFMVMLISSGVAIATALATRTETFHRLYLRNNPAPGIVRLGVVLSMGWIGFVLWRYADPSVTGIYVVFYLVMGYAVVKLFGQLTAALFGAVPRRRGRAQERSGRSRDRRLHPGHRDDLRREPVGVGRSGRRRRGGLVDPGLVLRARLDHPGARLLAVPAA